MLEFLFCILVWCCSVSMIEGWFLVYDSVEKEEKKIIESVAYFLG